MFRIELYYRFVKTVWLFGKRKLIVPTLCKVEMASLSWFWEEEDGISDFGSGIPYFDGHGIHVVVGAASDDPIASARSFLAGTLELTDNYCDH
ncbi:MAG: hypothetical protein KJ060_06945 [Candidatus Hydrogenedentes bacterium]|nr:hypothetical protein [Candidatus Hydrogenedentota bacterium]